MKRDSKLISCHVPAWMADRINRIADFWGESSSATIRMLLRDAFKSAPDPEVQELPLEDKKTEKTAAEIPAAEATLELV